MASPSGSVVRPVSSEGCSGFIQEPVLCAEGKLWGVSLLAGTGQRLWVYQEPTGAPGCSVCRTRISLSLCSQHQREGASGRPGVCRSSIICHGPRWSNRQGCKPPPTEARPPPLMCTHLSSQHVSQDAQQVTGAGRQGGTCHLAAANPKHPLIDSDKRGPCGRKVGPQTEAWASEQRSHFYIQGVKRWSS